MSPDELSELASSYITAETEEEATAKIIKFAEAKGLVLTSKEIIEFIFPFPVQLYDISTPFFFLPLASDIEFPNWD